MEQADHRVIEGWAALERRDIEEARAALQDVYSAHPSHPALPLLAAGIRRTRPGRVPWLQAIVLLVVIGGAFAGARYSVRHRSVLRADVTTAHREPSPAPVAAPTVPAFPPSATAVTTSSTARRTPSSTTHATPTLPDSTAPATADEVQIRQAITRFASAYSSKWGRLGFDACDIAPAAESTTVTCRAGTPAPDGSPDANALWTFACRKVGDAWKIVSVQPPSGSDRSLEPLATSDREGR